jgi:hypothetical protein
VSLAPTHARLLSRLDSWWALEEASVEKREIWSSSEQDDREEDVQAVHVQVDDQRLQVELHERQWPSPVSLGEAEWLYFFKSLT